MSDHLAKLRTAAANRWEAVAALDEIKEEERALAERKRAAMHAKDDAMAEVKEAATEVDDNNWANRSEIAEVVGLTPRAIYKLCGWTPKTEDRQTRLARIRSSK